MSKYIITCDEETASWIGNDVDFMKPIVRCRECKWLLEDERYSEAACRFYCRTLPKEGYRDGFCAWAERKEVDE